MSLKGNLAERPFPEILRNISSGSQSGTLAVRRDAIEKKISFEQGSVVFAVSNAPEDNFGELLIKIGRLSPSQLDEVLGISSNGKPFAQVLVEKGLFDQAQVREFLELHVQELIYPLFDWNNGEFEFTSSSPVVEGNLSLNISTGNLVLEGIRRIKNSEVIHKGLRGTETPIRLAPDYINRVTELFLKPDEAFILTRIESTLTIAEILQISPLGSEMTQKTLYGFISTGVAEFVVPERKRQVPPVKEAYRAQHAAEVAPSRPAKPALRPERPKAVDEDEDKEGEDRESEHEDIEALRSDILSVLDKSKSTNYYELLNVPNSAPSDEIKKSYYALAKKYHPDRYHQSVAPDLKAALDNIFAALSQAYDTLKVPATRASYDARIIKTAVEEKSAFTSEKTVSSQPTAPGTPQQKLADLNYRQGRGHYEQQDYWSATQAFRQSVRMEPENSRYRYWLGMALTKNPKWRREAEEHFLKAISLEQFNAANYVGLASLYKEVGMLKRAESQLKQALQISPGDKAAVEALHTLHHSKESEKKGLKSLKNLFRKK
jgi:curved DNA-binding protein CbpA